MARIKFTKGELKRTRDALRQYERYLPTLQLKKQQLQMEILRQLRLRQEKKEQEVSRRKMVEAWAGLLVDAPEGLEAWITPKEILVAARNIAGVDLPVFERAEFEPAEYDIFIIPLWVDAAVDLFRELVSLQQEIKVLEQGIRVLRDELRITTQRVNLFEKVKIPQAKEAIRLIKIYLGDQMTNAVGRSKIAKRKIEETVLEEVVV
ncbi:MAG: V-type ATP synthase subunit D [Candidatus Omnitrophota bacterium]|jgi:V/A-type H+-transporting ATPase subunit D|nr:MAG: V-type ATP synthase subunit D [Candidatus Omnitrophota bacterium]